MNFQSVCIILLLLVAGSWAYNPYFCDDEPAQKGPCKALLFMWRFNKQQQRCEPFDFGGCTKSKNIFGNESDCKRECLPESSK
uniref:Seminal fluid protein 30A9 n=1 Tax=Drosophila yakuba TaxID=7245 RepID=C4NAQ1_DROYA|nr:seminal fluid protein 30A9 [Drosophila yakuba]